MTMFHFIAVSYLKASPLPPAPLFSAWWFGGAEAWRIGGLVTWMGLWEFLKVPWRLLGDSLELLWDFLGAP